MLRFVERLVEDWNFCFTGFLAYWRKKVQVEEVISHCLTSEKNVNFLLFHDQLLFFNTEKNRECRNQFRVQNLKGMPTWYFYKFSIDTTKYF